MRNPNSSLFIPVLAASISLGAYHFTSNKSLAPLKQVNEKIKEKKVSTVLEKKNQ
jgi:hypothetical protein